MIILQPAATGINSSEIKLHNISAILLNLLHNKNVSRVSLAQMIGVSTATISNLVAELVHQGLIVEEGLVQNDGQAGVGRPQKALQLVADSRYAIGIHIDVGRVYITLTNIYGKILTKHTFDHQIQTPWYEVMDKSVKEIELIIEHLNINQDDIVGVGVAASGLVNPETGINIIAPNLNWHNVPIRDYLQDKLNMPIQVENNVRAMALGEALFGNQPHVNVMAFIYARIGVGAGLIMDRKIYRGAGAGAGEIGHTVVSVESCNGIETHTLESLFSESAILNSAKQQLSKSDNLTIQKILDIAQNGNQAICQLLEDRARYFGIALANLVNIFNPELIVLGGIFTYEQNLILPTVRSTLKQYSFANLSDNIRLEVTSFGQDAGMIGAAALALDTFFYRSPTPIQS